MPMLEPALNLGDAATGLPAVTAARLDQEGSRTLIWRLEIGGWSEREAGNLVALLRGLRPAMSGWSEREIDHLRFIRSLVDSGRLDS